MELKEFQEIVKNFLEEIRNDDSHPELIKLVDDFNDELQKWSP